MGAAGSTSYVDGNLKLNRAIPDQLVPESKWASPGNYGFLSNRFAGTVPGGYVPASSFLQNSAAHSTLTSEVLGNEAVVQSYSNRLGLQRTNGLLSPARGPWTSAADVVSGYGPGPEVVYGPAGMSGATVNPDLTKVLVNSTTWWITSPPHYVHYYKNVNPSWTHVPLGYVFRDSSPQPGPGFYMIAGNSVTVYGYVVFGRTMLTSTVFTKWYLPPGTALEPGTVNVTLEPGGTCMIDHYMCNNVSDYYRIEPDENRLSQWPPTYVSANINETKFTVTRSRAIWPESSGDGETDRTVFVNFRLTAKVVRP